MPSRPIYDLSRFGLQEMIESGKQLRLAALDAASMQQGAARIVDLFYDTFRSHTTSDSNLALARCFKTNALGTLPPALHSIARSKIPAANPDPAMRCLVLLASRGDHPDWNAPHTSSSHHVIPLPSTEIVEQAPMIARLIVQMGLTVEAIVQPQPGFLLDLETQTFNVFHVEEAIGSEFVPAQQTFVLPYRVRSVVGFGGLLPSGEFFAVVLFSKVSITRETAQLFRTLALSVKLALLPFAGRRIFND